MKIDLSELEKKLSRGINLTIEESTILIESIEGFIDDKIVLQEHLDTAERNIEHVIGTIKYDGYLGTVQTDWILPYLEKALTAIGGDGCPVSPIGVDGLIKYVQPTIWHNTTELEGSGDE